MAEAAMVLGISERQGFRLKARVGKEGMRGVVHGNRGRRSPRELPAQIRQQIVKLARDKYRGFNDHHLTEKLAEVEGVQVSRGTVRLLRAARSAGSGGDAPAGRWQPPRLARGARPAPDPGRRDR